jgi:hypothetical protein
MAERSELLPQFSRWPSYGSSRRPDAYLDLGSYSAAMPAPDPVDGFLPADPAPMELTPAQAFEVERHSRLLGKVDDAPTLRNLAKLLLQSWYAQKAATAWVMRQGMGR